MKNMSNYVRGFLLNYMLSVVTFCMEGFLVVFTKFRNHYLSTKPAFRMGGAFCDWEYLNTSCSVHEY